MQMTVTDGVAVQINGNDNTVSLVSPGAHLILDRRHLLKAAPRDLRELLLTEKRATELVGRAADLALLQDWLAGPGDITCRCLVARAGTGKTRLAIELCEWAEGQKWTAGFLRHDELRCFAKRQNLAGWRWGQDTLVVVDYAASSAAVLRQWLTELARLVSPPSHKLRLLLLERHAELRGGWWAELTRSGGMSGPGPDDLLDPPEPHVLPSLIALEARWALLAQTLRMAAEIEKCTIPPLPEPGYDPEFDRRLRDDSINNEPLYLLMAGVVALTTGVPAALSMGKLDLACRVAEAERSRLDRLADANRIERDVFRHLVACVTLQGGCDVAAARALVAAEKDSADRTDELVKRLATALPVPGTNHIDAVRPDLIGEAFVWMQLTGATSIKGVPQEGYNDRAEQCDIVARAFQRAGAATVATVVRAAQDLADGSADHATVAWLAHLAGLADDVPALVAIAQALPESTLALRELAREVTERIVSVLRAHGTTDEAQFSMLSGWLNGLSNRQSDLGDLDAALRSIEDAVEIDRALAAARPDAFRADLALSLNNLSSCQSDLGDHQAALRSIQEAVEIRRALAAANPDAFRPSLALSLNNLSLSQSAFGDDEAALRSIQEAVEIRRVLAAAHAFRPDLALSLNNLSFIQSARGDRVAALRPVQEAVEIYRALAARRPDAFLPDLAGSLNNLSVQQSALGDREAALRSIQEAVEIHRALAAARPDAFRPDLALSLWGLADRLDEAGDAAGGVAANAEAIFEQTPSFLRFPSAFAARMRDMVSEYEDRCAKANIVPDETLLAPLREPLSRLRQIPETTP